MSDEHNRYVLRHRQSFRGSHQQHASARMNYYVDDTLPQTTSSANAEDFMYSGDFNGGSSSDSDFNEELDQKSNGGNRGNRVTKLLKRKKKTTTGQSDCTSSSNYSGGHGFGGGDDSEWIQCRESDTGRLIWYNRDTLMVTFENPILNNLHRGRNDSILKESIAREDIDDNLIPRYILRFGSQQWDFNNDYVDVFRSQSARIDHTKLLPHPNDLVFPEFFSNHRIPKKESFVATILPPIDFNITSTSWKMAINVNKTTASDIIEKFVAKVCILFVYGLCICYLYTNMYILMISNIFNVQG